MAIFDELKSIGKVLREADKIEQYNQILDVQEKLLEMQNRIIELDSENRVLKEQLETKASLIFEKNAYWIEQEEVKDGPFCSCCWDDNKKPIRMQPCGNPAFYNCPKCTNKEVNVYPEKDIRKNQFNNRQNFNGFI